MRPSSHEFPAYLLRSLFCFFILIAKPYQSQSQELNTFKNIPIASPNSASLGKFVDVPVNYHTGIPNIDIPIYTVQEGPLQLSVGLSYHASGLKVTEQASWVGAGWALNSGGVINRSVNGSPDELLSASSGVGYLQSHGYYSYLYNNNVLDYLTFSRGEKDGEPDLFFFNFNGYSGKFYFRSDSTIVTVPQQEIVIKPLFGSETVMDYLNGFIVTTPDGVNYYFGKTTSISTDVDAVEHTYPYSLSDGQSFTKIISSWYLYKIESGDKQFSINLTYAKESYNYYALSTFPVQRYSSGTATNTSGISIVKNLMEGLRLTSITSSNGSVEFVPDVLARKDLSRGTQVLDDTDNVDSDPLAPRALKEIRITNGAGSLCKSFEFSYSYFENNTPLYSTYGGLYLAPYNIHSDQKRLKLNSVKEKSCDNSISNPPYKFSYYDEDKVPRTLSLAQDHWGFYNGAITNSEFVPSVSTNDGYFMNEGYGANREPSWPAMRYGSLKTIQYPTGGSAKFSYGSHKVFVNRQNTNYTDTGYSITARGSSPPYTTSTIWNVNVTSTTVYRVKTRTFEGGSGTVYLGNQVFAAGPEWAQYLVVLSPGTYQFYCTVSGQLYSHQGVEATLDVRTLNYSWMTVPVGGLRIDTLSFNDGKSADVLRTVYAYSDGHSVDQAILYSRPNYIALAKNDRMRASGVAFSTNGSNGFLARASDGCITASEPGQSPIKSYIISPGSIHPMQTTQGNHVGYNQVKVVQPDGGYTIYQYVAAQNAAGDVSVNQIDMSICDYNAPNYPPAPEPYNPSRGELQAVTMFNANGVMLKDTQYKSDYVFEPVGVNGLIVRGVNTYLLSTEYEMKTVKKTKSTAVEFVYDPVTQSQAPQGTITETFFESPFHRFESKKVISEIVSGNAIDNIVKGKVISETRQTYVPDLTDPACVQASCEQPLLSAISQADITYQSAMSACGSDPTCLFNAWHSHANTVNNARITYSNCLISNNANKRACLSNAYNSSSPELKTIYDLRYRAETGRTIEQSKWRDGKLIGSALLNYQDYGNNRKNINPGTMYVITPIVPSTSFTPVTITSSSLVKDPAYVLEETYFYKDGNLVEVKGKDGVFNSYIWSYNNTLPVVKAVGPSFSTLSAAYVAVAGDLTALRNQSTLTQSMVSTYTYAPWIGALSMTDPAGNLKYFEYDKIGRLRFVKDAQNNIEKEYRYDFYKR
jgi:hypothetical protein